MNSSLNLEYIVASNCYKPNVSVLYFIKDQIHAIAMILMLPIFNRLTTKLDLKAYHIIIIIIIIIIITIIIIKR